MKIKYVVVSLHDDTHLSEGPLGFNFMREMRLATKFDTHKLAETSMKKYKGVFEIKKVYVIT